MSKFNSAFRSRFLWLLVVSTVCLLLVNGEPAAVPNEAKSSAYPAVLPTRAKPIALVREGDGSDQTSASMPSAEAMVRPAENSERDDIVRIFQGYSL